MKEISVADREKHIAQASFSSSFPIEEASVLINFPKDVRGLTIVDIGAGASTVVLGLQRHGANAIAIDYRYEDLREVKKSIDRHLSNTTNVRKDADSKDYDRLLRKNMKTFFMHMRIGKYN